MTVQDTEEHRIQRASVKAGDYEEESRNCAQGTLAALMEEFGLTGGEDVLKAASFMPGVASSRETCGALLGGLMALGLVYGRGQLSNPEWKKPGADEEWQKVRRKMNAYCEAFKAEFGTISCSVIRPALMGRDYDPLDPEDRKQFVADGGIQMCRFPPKVAARLAATLLLEDEE